MKKQDLLNELSDKTGVSTTSIEQVLRALGHSVAQRVKGGEAVKIPGLAMVTAKSYSARPGRNPKTGESVEVPAALRVRFKPIKAFDDQFVAG